MPSNKKTTIEVNDIQPLVSEKAVDLNRINKFVFLVKNALNKSEIRKRIEKKYKVNVIGMNMVKIAKKNLKKAIVTLKKGQIINEKV